MSKTKTNYCPVTGKQMFDRRSQAEKVAYRTQRRKRCTKRGSVYLCQHCGKFHVTHYTYEDNRDFQTMYKKRVFYYLIEDYGNTDLQPTRHQVHKLRRQVPCIIKTRLS